MDLEEAKQKIEISEDERNAVGNYISSFHADMNTLIGFNMLDYFAAQKRGWKLPGDGRDKRTSEEVGAEVLDWLDRATLVYSAMVKSSYRGTAPQALWRGTSVKEIEAVKRRGTYGKFLSTTITEDIAKKFTVPTEGDALLRIYRPPEVPFIDVSEFIGDEDYINQNEKEYVLAPFTKISSCTMRSNWNGYKYYDVGLEKPEMRAFEEGEKDTLREEIKAGFTEALKIGQEFAQVNDRLEWIYDKFSRTTSSEERQWLREERERMEQKYSELRSQVEGFEIKMEHYAQGIFVEKEREINQAYDIVRTEEARIRQEETERREQEALERESQAVRTSASRLDGIESTPQIFYNTYESLKTEEARYRNVAQTLGIPFSMQLPTKSISDNLQAMEEHIKVIRERAQELSGQTYESTKSALKASCELGGYVVAFDDAKAQRDSLYRVTEDYEAEAMFEAKKGIDERIQDIIKRTKLQVIEMKKREVQERKISFWGRLRGLDKLQEAELRNLGLEEELVKKTPIVEKAEYSVHDSLAELRAFSRRELDGLATDEMMKFDASVRSFFSVDDSEISARADMKNRNLLPAVIQPKKRRLSTAKKIARANEKTEALKAELAEVKKENVGAISFGNTAQNTKSNALENFAQIIKTTVRATTPTFEGYQNQQAQNAQNRSEFEDTLDLFGSVEIKKKPAEYPDFDEK